MGLFSKTKRTEAIDAGSGEGFLARISDRLTATRRGLGQRLAALISGRSSVDASLAEDIEALLLGADVGIEATRDIIGRITRAQARTPEELYAELQAAMLAIIAPCAQPLTIPAGVRPYVIMVVGVNGAGKTTTVGKLAHRLQSEGYSLMLAAGDTFRAAAVEQLQAWGERNGIPVMAQGGGADAAAVAHDAMQAAVARAVDVLIIDTAGRLHTQTGLMDELRKIKRVIGRFDARAPHEVLLVLDAGIGQNALAQLTHFHSAVGVTGLCLTKLDGTAKGGILFAMAEKHAIPIRLIGVGEDIDDLRVFDAAQFVDAILPRAE
ncbi:MAG: signal recognition particle-docking protein FtsY [Gammaproteobacteria bacterium]|nr:signal recognition particle-docking protein FtsY [Gammaproteobacteria bacterium]